MRRNFSAAQERCPPENYSLFATRHLSVAIRYCFVLLNKQQKVVLVT